MCAIQVIGLTAHHVKEEVIEALRHITQTLKHHGLEYIFDEKTAGMLSETSGYAFPEFLEKADMVFSLGGDGTFLHRAAKVAQAGKPLAGINLGRLGFMTAGSVQEVHELIDAIVNHRYIIEQRDLLKATLIGDRNLGIASPEIDTFYALNEIAILRSNTGRMVDVESFVNGSFLSYYHADGLLVATPSGSTAYSLSAGGPIISPEASVICLTPVCPHSLTNRSLVLSDTVKIEVRSRLKSEEEAPIVFSIDGNEIAPISSNMRLLIIKSPQPLQVVRLPHYNFTKLLRKKLRWSGSEV